MARPHAMLARSFIVMLVVTSRLPKKVDPAAIVAEVPTTQYTPAPAPAWTIFTSEPGDVISVVGIVKTQYAFGLPPPSSVKVWVRLVFAGATL